VRRDVRLFSKFEEKGVWNFSKNSEKNDFSHEKV